MRVLLDTNVLLRRAKSDHPQHTLALRSIESLALKSHELCLVPQVLFEFWAVATRPVANNGLGLSVAEAREHLERIRNGPRLLEDQPRLVDEWLQLVVLNDVKGKLAHDARIVASMRQHGVDAILTFNAGDFQRFDGTRVLEPSTVIASA